METLKIHVEEIIHLGEVKKNKPLFVVTTNWVDHEFILDRGIKWVSTQANAPSRFTYFSNLITTSSLS